MPRSSSEHGLKSKPYWEAVDLAITFPIAPPLDFVTELDISEFNASTFITSPFTGRGVTQTFEGEYWNCTLRYRNLGREDGQALSAFRSALRGSTGSFVVPFPGIDNALGLARLMPSSPSVDDGFIEGSSLLPIADAVAGIAGYFLAGDILQVGPNSRPHWHRILEDVDIDSTGRALIEVWPVIREGTQAGDQVSYARPLCLFKMIGEIDTSIRTPVIYNLDIIARELL